MKTQNTTALVKELKENNQDFEFYPTTVGQIKCITDDISKILETHEFSSRYREPIKILDIGAGDGRVLESISENLEKKFEETNQQSQEILKFAIEKSNIQSSQYRKNNINLIGTEFNEVNFISKSADIAFCNPPYSEFSLWISTLISQLNFKILYVVMPERWEHNNFINDAIQTRCVTDITVLQESDFLNAERKARAKVQVVRFSFNDFENEIERSTRLNRSYKLSIGIKSTDPFQQFIETQLNLKNTFGKNTNKFSETCEAIRVKQEAKENKRSDGKELVKYTGLLNTLIENYNLDIEHVLSEYKKIGELDTALLQELGVDYDSIVTGISEKLFGYRNVYWSVLFDNLEVLSGRLTAKNKKFLLETLKKNSLDFTYKNAIYIIDYAVQMTNELVQDSLITVFKQLTSKESISKYYKSNTHMYKDSWRYNTTEKDASKYELDYRFIYSAYSNFGNHFNDHGLTENARDFVNDLIVVLKLLGYGNIEVDKDYNDVKPRDKLTITGTDSNNKELVLLTITIYQNGNRHIKFNQTAMQRFNITVSRILGWVRSKEDYNAETENKVSDNNWNVLDKLNIGKSQLIALTDKRTIEN